MLYLPYSGLLHSDIHGSLPACGSPWLFAAYRVLLRLPMPRHPPCALFSLTFLFRSFRIYAWFFFEILLKSRPFSLSFLFDKIIVSYLRTSFRFVRYLTFFLIALLLLYSVFKMLSTDIYPLWWAQVDSNHRPHAYQACALTTWAMRPYRS